jgi:hypothetical protein
MTGMTRFKTTARMNSHRILKALRNPVAERLDLEMVAHMRLGKFFHRRLKPGFFVGLIGSAEAVLFHKTSLRSTVHETSYNYLGEYRRSGLVLTAPAQHLFLQEGNLL